MMDDYLIQEVWIAYPDQPRPFQRDLGFTWRDFDLGFLCDKSSNLGISYRAIPDELYAKNCESLFHLRGMAFRYYIPGYTLACLGSASEGTLLPDCVADVFNERSGEISQETNRLFKESTVEQKHVMSNLLLEISKRVTGRSRRKLAKRAFDIK